MNRKVLFTAVASTLVASASPPAEALLLAYSQLFPYVVKDANRTTVITLIGGGDFIGLGKASIQATAEIHLQYWTKSTTDANTAACQPSSVYVPMTENDVVTFDTAGLLGYPLFGDETNPAPLGMSISYPAPRHGYLLALSADVGGLDARIQAPLIGLLQAGYWVELDLANGGAHGDYSLRGQGPNFLYGGIDPDGIYGITGQNSLEPWVPRAVNFWPSSVASTVFTVTPLGSRMDTSDNNQTVLQVFNSNAVQGAYDRNENGVDGTVPQTVRCVGRLTPAQLMPGVVANANWAAQGGWGFLENRGDGDTNIEYTAPGANGGLYFTMTDDHQAVVYQVDQSSASGKFMSNATRIVSNDGGITIQQF